MALLLAQDAHAQGSLRRRAAEVNPVGGQVEVDEGGGFGPADGGPAVALEGGPIDLLDADMLRAESEVDLLGADSMRAGEEEEVDLATQEARFMQAYSNGLEETPRRQGGPIRTALRRAIRMLPWPVPQCQW
jgi:hypothetical protein